MNLPNLLSLARLIASAPAFWAILEGRFTLALILLLLAGVSDVLDGVLARRRRQVTRLGAYLDPVADKLLLSGSYLALGMAGVAPGWLVAIVLGRDALILLAVGAALAFSSLREFPPSAWGKTSTVVQVVTGVTLLASAACPWPWLGQFAAFLVWLTAAATLWSGLDYAIGMLARLRRLDAA
ncbi:MAG: CDP-alcohol phosphatidyltransferase family protein [Bryobacterales bacterium]|nr:CDP-alcohol phosphatidyltransferase family protein [Bryobacteraceae bacterium]MDW8130059.1 CDP-alcohol phosphatidyltransferase family protein [Bryobacterales bacterium]